jgi:hypothetical protein
VLFQRGAAPRVAKEKGEEKQGHQSLMNPEQTFLPGILRDRPGGEIP